MVMSARSRAALLVAVAAVASAQPSGPDYPEGPDDHQNITIQTWQKRAHCEGVPDQVASFLPGGPSKTNVPFHLGPIALLTPRFVRCQSARRSATRRGCGCGASRFRVSWATSASRW